MSVVELRRVSSFCGIHAVCDFDMMFCWRVWMGSYMEDKKKQDVYINEGLPKHSSGALKNDLKFLAVARIIEHFHSDLSQTEILRCVSEEFRRLIPYDHFTLTVPILGWGYHFDDEAEVLERYERDGSFITDATYSASRWVLHNKQSILRSDISKDHRFEQDTARIQEGIFSDLLVPLVVNDICLGALNLQSKVPRTFKQHHLEDALALSTTLATLVNQLQIKLETEAIQQLAKSMQKSLDLESIEKMALEHIQSQGYDRVRLYFYDETKKALVGRAQFGEDMLHDFTSVEYPVETDPYALQTLAANCPCIYQTDTEQFQDLLVKRKKQIPFFSLNNNYEIHREWCEIPLIVVEGGERIVVGKISIDNARTRFPLVKERVDRLMAYAHQIAVTVRHAQLHQGVVEQAAQLIVANEEQKAVEYDLKKAHDELEFRVVEQTAELRYQLEQQDALLKVGQAVQGMVRASDLDNVIRVCLDALNTIGVDAQAMAIHRIVDTEQSLIETYRIVKNGPILASERRRGSRLTRIWKRQLIYGPVVVAEDEVKNFENKFSGLVIRSCVDVSFSRGVISVHSTQPNALSEENVEVIKQIAEIFSVGISRLEDLEELEVNTRALQESEEKFRRLLEYTPYGIVLVNKEGRINLVNAQTEALFGYYRDELLGARVDVLMPEGFRDVHQKHPKNYNVNSKMRSMGSGLELFGRRKDGSEFPIDISLGPVEIDGETLIIGIIIDVTEQEKLEEQLRQSQKMEAVGKLAGGVAHDFNNLLTVINGYTQMLLSRVHDDETRNILELVGKAGHRAASLTRQLLAFSRKQMLQPEILNINDILTDTSKMLQRLIGEDIKLDTVFRSDIGQVKADPGQLEQVMMNLVVNARDAMPQGGTITIETAEKEIGENYVMHSVVVEPGYYVVISVGDTGTGMDEETQRRIFEPFFTTKGVGKGTGLGLSMVYGIVKQSEGYIGVDSVVGKGTVFKIYLKRIEERIVSDEHIEIEEQLEGGSETILLVEDEDMVRNFTRQVLIESGYTVLEASCGEKAFEVCKAYDGPIHLVLTDVVMPELSGREVAEHIKSFYPNLKVLFMSGYTDDAVLRHGVIDSEVTLIKKPFAPDDILKQIREILDA